MATAKPRASASKSRRGHRRDPSRFGRARSLLPWVAIGLALAGAVWGWFALRASAVAGAAYGARIACSCHYVGGRDLKDCRKDFEPGMGRLVMLGDDPATRRVTGTIPLFARQGAQFRPGEGCVLEPWGN